MRPRRYLHVRTGGCVAAQGRADADQPGHAALGKGAESKADAYLTAALGRIAEPILAPEVHVVIDLGETEALALVSAAFAKARALVPSAEPALAPSGPTYPGVRPSAPATCPAFGLRVEEGASLI